MADGVARRWVKQQYCLRQAEDGRRLAVERKLELFVGEPAVCERAVVVVEQPQLFGGSCRYRRRTRPVGRVGSTGGPRGGSPTRDATRGNAEGDGAEQENRPTARMGKDTGSDRHDRLLDRVLFLIKLDVGRSLLGTSFGFRRLFLFGR